MPEAIHDPETGNTAHVATSGALYVQLVDSSGSIIKATIQEENRAGSDCNGSDGATGRVLTLQNTSTSGAPISVWIDGQLISLSDMTISHKASSSTITFDSVNVFNAQAIRVSYYI